MGRFSQAGILRLRAKWAHEKRLLAVEQPEKSRVSNAHSDGRSSPPLAWLCYL